MWQCRSTIWILYWSHDHLPVVVDLTIGQVGTLAIKSLTIHIVTAHIGHIPSAIVGKVITVGRLGIGDRAFYLLLWSCLRLNALLQTDNIGLLQLLVTRASLSTGDPFEQVDYLGCNRWQLAKLSGNVFENIGDRTSVGAQLFGHRPVDVRPLLFKIAYLLSERNGLILCRQSIRTNFVLF